MSKELIEKLKKGLNNKHLTAAQKKSVQAKIDSLEKLDKKSEKAKPVKKVAEPKKEVKAKPAKKEKVSTADKKEFNRHRVGRSKDDLAKDSKRIAMKGGKRISANGNVYYEKRPNRSDVNPRKRFEDGGNVDAGDKYIVVNEKMLAVTIPSRFNNTKGTDEAEVIAIDPKEIGFGDKVGDVMFLKNKKVRPATSKDFDKYRVVEPKSSKKESDYKIVTGHDHKNNHALYHVVGIDNDYVGEWHKDKKDAEDELKDLNGISDSVSKFAKGGTSTKLGLKADDLVKGEVYIYSVDPKIPLKFTGKLYEGNEQILAYFEPVKTDENKNWYDKKSPITIGFDYFLGNDYVKVKKSDKFESGGNVSSINWQNFTLNELSDYIKNEYSSDIQLNTFSPLKEVKTNSGTEFKQDDFISIGKISKKDKDESLSIGYAKQIEATSGSENVYLNIVVYRNDSDKPFMLSIYTKEDKKGIKELANEIIEKFEEGGNVTNSKQREVLYKSEKERKELLKEDSLFKRVIEGSPTLKPNNETGVVKVYSRMYLLSPVKVVEAIEEIRKENGYKTYTKKFEDGGNIEEEDLFENYDELPVNIQDVLSSYQDEDGDYADLEEMQKELKPLGYTFDYGLDAVPFNLRKIDKMAKGGVVKSIDKVRANLGEETFKYIGSLNKTELEKQLYNLRHELNRIKENKDSRYYKLKDEEWFILYRLEKSDEFEYAKGGVVDKELINTSAKTLHDRNGMMYLRNIFLQAAKADENSGDKATAEYRRKVVAEYQSKEPKIFEKGGSIAKCPVGTKIQTIIFSKEFFNKTKAVKWLDKNNYKGTIADDKSTTVRFRQVSPDKFEDDSFRTIELTKGIKAVIGCPKKK